jgi:phosphoglycolate phosphatase-like HAD superfamily hydrolase
MNDFRKYKTFIFDCDGVILNSNEIKTNCFKKILKKYNHNAVEEFINYHKENGGISRYIKLEYFLKNILPKYSNKYKLKHDELNNLLLKYSYECINSLSNSDVTKNLKEIRKITGNIPWIVVSGGDQDELKKVFEYKNIYKYFNGGVYGSPDKKTDIIDREIKKGNINYPALMFGDSKLDHEVSVIHEIDFIFVNKWSDFKDYSKYCRENSIREISYLYDFFIE